MPRRLVVAVSRRDQVESLLDLMRSFVPCAESDLGKRLLSCALPMGIAVKVKETDARSPVVVSDSTPRLVNEWKRDPTRPAIIVETQDSLLEDLLFRWSAPLARSQVAGLLGQDALWLLDQSHVEEQCALTLSKVHALQDGSLRRIWVWRVGLFAEHDLRIDPLRRPQRCAFLHSNLSTKGLVEKVCEEARSTGPRRIIVFLNKAAEVQKITKALREELGEELVSASLTGRYRGHERQQLVTQLRVAFARDAAPKTSRVLVTNAAGELGVDLDAETIFCDVVEPDRMNRRFARVTQGTIHVLVVKENPVTTAIEQSPKLGDGFDVTDLIFADDTEDPVDLRPLSQAEVDALSFTNGRTPPDIMSLIRTLNPESTCRIAWRSEASLFLNAFNVSASQGRESLGEDYEDFLEVCPLQSHEMVRVPATRDFIRSLPVGRKALLVRHGGSVEYVDDVHGLDDAKLGRSVLVFPPSGGMLDAEGQFDPQATTSVQDLFNGRLDEEPKSNSPRRVRVLIQPSTSDASYNVVALDDDTFESIQAPSKAEAIRLAVACFEEAGMPLLENFDYPMLDAVESRRHNVLESAILVFGDRRRFFGSLRAGRDQTIEEHEQMAETWAREILRKLPWIPANLGERIALAARKHDEGKAHPLWQRSLGDLPTGKEGPWAKRAQFPERSRRKRINCGFRHEFTSLHQLLTAGVTDDLVLHLVASHHGYARPYFLRSGYDYTIEAPREVNLDTMRRFVRVQREVGWWDLAYLEALLRASDVQASIYQNGMNP